MRLALPLLAFALAAGCQNFVDTPNQLGAKKSDGSASVTASAASLHPVLPSPTGTGALSPWGGSDASKWRPEAIIANAASTALNDAYSDANVVDALVAIPTKMETSSFYEFGDGQSNAAPSFEYWSEKRPPVVVTLLKYADKSEQLRFRFDRKLPYAGNEFRIHSWYDGLDQEHTFTTTTDANGDKVATIAPPFSVNENGSIWDDIVLVSPDGWSDWFPITFQIRIGSVDTLEATMPSAMKTLSDGSDVVDPLKVSQQNDPTKPLPWTSLMQMNPANWNFFDPGDIHGVFPGPNGTVVTGVGMGWTWVAQSNISPFKLMYTCFSKRDPNAEANAPNGGVASGGGWHRIGDPAETILNDVEAGSTLVGYLKSNLTRKSALPSGSFSYGLGEVAVLRFLLPGEAFEVGRGVKLDDGTSVDEFHWYAMNSDHNVCTEEWVHPCRPDKSGNGDVTFQCQGAVLEFNDFSVGEFTQGVVSQLGSLAVNYDPRRAQCGDGNGVTNTMHWRTDGGQWQSAAFATARWAGWLVLQSPPTIPLGAKDLEIFFESQSSSCHAYDSNYGGNYHFAVQ